MADVDVSFGADFSELLSQLGTLNEKIKGVNGAGAGKSVARGMDQARQAAQRAGSSFSGAQSRAQGFFSGFRGAARATGGVLALTAAGVVLSRRFPVIRSVAAQSFRAVAAGARSAAGSAGNLASTIGSLRRAGIAAVGIYSLARAFRTLRDSRAAATGGGGGAGAGGGIFGPIFSGSLLGNLAAQGIGAAMRGVRAAVSAGMQQVRSALGSAADMEQTKGSFGVMLGSDKMASDLLAEIQKKAASTPFELPDLTAAAQKLLNYGLTADKIMPTLDMLGDISGGSKEKLDALANVFGQMSSTGRLMGQDLLQMINAGFNPLQEMAASTGKSIAELKKDMESGAISSEMATAAFQAATTQGGRFYGMLERQSKTATGLMSNLRDAWGQNLLAFGQPVLESIKPALEDAIALVEAMKSGAVEWGGKLSKGIDFVRAAVAELSGGELMAMVGDSLIVAFQEGVNFLSKGVQAVFSSVQDSDFMSGVSDQMEMAGLRLKEILLLTAAEFGESLIATLPKGAIHQAKATNAIDYLRATADLADAQREAIAESGGNKSVTELAGKFAENFAKASNVYDTSGRRAKLAADAAKIQARAESDRLARKGQDVETGSVAGSGGGGSAAPASQRFAANAVQSAVNALFGRSQEVQQTSLLKQIADNTKPRNESTNRPPTPGTVPGTAAFA